VSFSESLVFSFSYLGTTAASLFVLGREEELLAMEVRKFVDNGPDKGWAAGVRGRMRADRVKSIITSILHPVEHWHSHYNPVSS
jgi:hypothetical protein